MPLLAKGFFSTEEHLRELREAGKQHPIEDIGKKLRAMMPFVSAGKQKVADVSGGDTDE